jgi:hypothetical protein
MIYDDGRPRDAIWRRYNREIRFRHKQGITHNWISFRSIVELWSDRAELFLRADLKAGRLPHTLFIHAGSKLQFIPPEGESFIGPEARDCCWIPRADFAAWCERWSLPIEQAAEFASEVAIVDVAEAPIVPAVAAAPAVTQPPTESPQRRERRTRQTNLVLAALRERYGVLLTDDVETVKGKTENASLPDLVAIVQSHCERKNLPEARWPSDSTIARVTGRKIEK